MSRAVITRRQWLRASGAAGLLFPWLRALPARADTAPPALVMLMQANGTNQASFWPSTAADSSGSSAPPAPLRSRILAPLLDDPRLASRTTLVRGLFHAGQGKGNEHDKGFAGLFSGFPTVGETHDPWGGGPSLDQVLKARMALSEPFPTLNCGVLATNAPPFKAHRASFSYLGARQPVPTEVDPYKLYAQLFAAATPPLPGEDVQASSKRRLREKRSVLDHVTGELRALRARVGALDGQRLEAQATSLRQIERRLEASLGATAGAREPRCAYPQRPNEGLDATLEDNVPGLTRVMCDFLALALACRLTRVVTFQLGHSGEVWYFRWLGINENSHDDIAHRDDGVDRAAAAKVVAINHWHAQQVAYLARALDQLPDGAGTALDRTLLVWGNEVATGTHALTDIPIVLVGGAGGRLAPSAGLVDQGEQDHRRLGTTLMRVMGVPASGFGDSPDCGPLQGLSVR